MTRYVGLDLHTHIVQASLIHEQEKRLESHRFAAREPKLKLKFASGKARNGLVVGEIPGSNSRQYV